MCLCVNIYTCVCKILFLFIFHVYKLIFLFMCCTPIRIYELKIVYVCVYTSGIHITIRINNNVCTFYSCMYMILQFLYKKMVLFLLLTRIFSNMYPHMLDCVCTCIVYLYSTCTCMHVYVYVYICMHVCSAYICVFILLVFL